MGMRLGGVSEVAGELGVSRQRVAQIRTRADFPDPIGELAQGSIWDLDAVSAWRDSGLRSGSGRPSRSAPRVLGARFVLEEKIGEGGFADVYRAADRKHAGTPAAVKILRDVDNIDPEALRRFGRELRILETLEHPHVISVIGHGQTESGEVWYAMPLAQGSLAEYVDGSGWAAPDVLTLMRQVGAGLAHVHQRGVFHRDLKPGNILRTESGWAIADFGLATEVERTTTVLTSTRRAGLGSHWYTAPEQWTRARDANHLSDIFSLGKILQELTTGEAPVSNEMPAGPLRPVVQRATANRPRDRHHDVGELITAVESALTAVSGRWEAPEDAALRLLEQVRLPKPAAEDLEALMVWAHTLDETAWHDMVALARVLPWISSWSIRTVWATDPVRFGQVFNHFSDHVSSNGFDFAFCDVIADFTRRVVREVDEAVVLAGAVRALAGMGHRHNRWHVRSVVVTILQDVRGDEAAVAALEGLRGAGLEATRWAVDDFGLRSLHPTLGRTIEQLLSAGDDQAAASLSGGNL